MNVRLVRASFVSPDIRCFFVQGELATRLSQFGPVRIEWPAENNRTRRRTNHGKDLQRSSFFDFVSLRSSSGKSGYAYAIFDKESSVHELLLACCQQPQRNSDGRCEYYLNLNSQRSASKRKSVRLRFLSCSMAIIFLFVFRFN